MQESGSIEFDLGQIEDVNARSTIEHRRRELRGLFAAALAARPGIDQIDIDRAALSTALVEHSDERMKSGSATCQDHVMASLAWIASKARAGLALPPGIYEERETVDE